MESDRQYANALSLHRPHRAAQAARGGNGTEPRRRTGRFAGRICRGRKANSTELLNGLSVPSIEKVVFQQKIHDKEFCVR